MGAGTSEVGPPPAEVRAGSAPLVIVADHAGRRVPPELGDLGLDPGVFDLHVAYDLGVREVAEALGAATGAWVVCGVYSRLVVDLNRHPRHSTFIPASSDGITVPANLDLDEGECRRRTRSYFDPYHSEVASVLSRADAAAGSPVPLFSVHSFTPELAGERRPWDCGVLWDRDEDTARALLAGLRAEGLHVGDNEPYSGRHQSEYGFTIPEHAEQSGRAHVLLEIRQDLLARPADIAAWVLRLEGLVDHVFGASGPTGAGAVRGC